MDVSTAIAASQPGETPMGEGREARVQRWTGEQFHETSATFGLHSEVKVLLQKDREVANAYGVYGTPGTVLIGIDVR